MRDSSLDLRPGERFLDFQIGRELGRGGVGVVHEIAYRGQRQALKLIRPEWVNDPAMVPRMFNEGQILMRINHPYIVTVHDAGITGDNWVWIRMELLDGRNLRETMRRSGPMSLPRVCAFLRTAAHAAHQCHVFGIIHRDIKPENFMVVQDEDGDYVLKLLDFGLAKLYGADTRDLRLIGTPQYMAPEQWNKDLTVTPATDLYAIATMIQEAYVGHHPLFPDGKEDNPWRMMKAHHETVPVPLEHYGMPAGISELIMKALAKDPRRRPQDAHQWAEDVWAAWRKVRDAHPEIDTHPGEPPLDRIRSRPLLVSATNPLSPWHPPAEPAPIAHAGTQRMRATAGGLMRPSPQGGARGPRGGATVKLPDEQRDPSCVAAEASAPAPGTTMPIPPHGEARPLAPGSTGTVPIELAAPFAPALPFRPAIGAPGRERSVTLAAVAEAPRESAPPIPVATTAPLEGATSGVRRVEPPSAQAHVSTPLPSPSPLPLPLALPLPSPRRTHRVVRYGAAALFLAVLVGAFWIRKTPAPASGTALEHPPPTQALPAPEPPPPSPTAAPGPLEAPAATNAPEPTAAPTPPSTMTAPARPKPRPISTVAPKPKPSVTTVPSAVPSAAPTAKKRLPTNPSPRKPAAPEPGE
jgi:serine/threonine protein kinase